MNRFTKEKRSFNSWLTLTILLVLILGMIGCDEEDEPGGFIIFYEDTDCRGRSYLVGFNNSAGAVKWDTYDIESSLEDNCISSFEIFAYEPTTLILCEDSHFRGDFVRFNITQCRDWFQVDDLGIVDFNDKISSVIATNENESAILSDTPIEFFEALEAFRTEVETRLEDKDSIDGIDLWRTRIHWDTKLNVLTRSVFDDDDASYSPAFEYLKNDDLIRFYQRFDLDPDGWPKNYEVRLSFWIEPTSIDGNMGISGWAWEYWVEGGCMSKRIARDIEADMDESLDDLATTIDTTIRDRMSPYAAVLTTNIERISFTLPDPQNPSLCNPYRGGINCGNIASTPPIIILQRHD